MNKIAFVSVGVLPVPDTKGGAVEALITSLVRQNEKEKKLQFEIFSIGEEEAKEVSKKYKLSKVWFYDIPNGIKIFDLMIYRVFKKLFPKKNYNQARYILQRLYFIWKCKKELIKNDYDKVILENHPSLMLILKDSRILKKYKGKIIYHIHNEFGGTYGCRKQLNEIDCFISVSNALSENVSQKYSLDKNKFIVLKNCIDKGRFNKQIDCEKIEQLKSLYGIKNGERVIVFAGRLTKGKGVHILIKAFSKLNLPNLKLVIVGGVSFTLDFHSEYEQELHELANSNVIFTGFVPYSEMHYYYQMADIGVFPSIAFEAAGLTIIEAMSCGLPVITVNTGGISEYTGDAAVLLKNDSGIEKEMEQQMMLLLNNSEKLKEMREKSIVETKKYTEEDYYLNFISLLNRIKETKCIRTDLV